MKSVLPPVVTFSDEYCLLLLHVPRELQKKGDSSPWEKGEVGNVWSQSLTRNCPQSETKWVLGKLLKAAHRRTTGEYRMSHLSWTAMVAALVFLFRGEG